MAAYLLQAHIPLLANDQQWSAGRDEHNLQQDKRTSGRTSPTPFPHLSAGGIHTTHFDGSTTASSSPSCSTRLPTLPTTDPVHPTVSLYPSARIAQPALQNIPSTEPSHAITSAQQVQLQGLLSTCSISSPSAGLEGFSCYSPPSSSATGSTCDNEPGSAGSSSEGGGEDGSSGHLQQAAVEIGEMLQTPPRSRQLLDLAIAKGSNIRTLTPAMLLHNFVCRVGP